MGMSAFVRTPPILLPKKERLMETWDRSEEAVDDYEPYVGEGAIIEQFVKCGKPNCRCREGRLRVGAG
jgi:hypothetical protein